MQIDNLYTCLPVSYYPNSKLPWVDLYLILCRERIDGGVYQSHAFLSIE